MISFRLFAFRNIRISRSESFIYSFHEWFDCGCLPLLSLAFCNDWSRPSDIIM